jgi:hypothetical protein
VTGGDPLIMSTGNLRRALEPLLAQELDHIRTIRLGTKALTYWPHRFLGDDDADDLLRLFEQIRNSGRHLALMAHVTHPHELSPDPVRRAVERVRSTGAVIRTQAPMIRSINDDAGVWQQLWTRAVALDAVPYYMFVERDTGPRHYFEVPLVRAWQIYRDTLSSVTGLARTMSTTRGKVVVDGVTEIAGHSAIALRHLQARDPQRPQPYSAPRAGEPASNASAFHARYAAEVPSGGQNVIRCLRTDNDSLRVIRRRPEGRACGVTSCDLICLDRAES